MTEHDSAEEHVDERFVEISPQKEYYLDPEGGYSN